VLCFTFRFSISCIVFRKRGVISPYPGGAQKVLERAGLWGQKEINRYLGY